MNHEGHEEHEGRIGGCQRRKSKGLERIGTFVLFVTFMVKRQFPHPRLRLTEA